MNKINPIKFENGKLYLLDQRVLPHITEYVELTTAAGVYDAISDMVVRGAPAIGVAAACVPQGMPAQISVALSLGVGRLASKKAIVKKL